MTKIAISFPWQQLLPVCGKTTTTHIKNGILTLKNVFPLKESFWSRNYDPFQQEPAQISVSEMASRHCLSPNNAAQAVFTGQGNGARILLRGLSLHQRGWFVFREHPLVLMRTTDAAPQALGWACLLVLFAKIPSTMAGALRSRNSSLINTAPLWESFASQPRVGETELVFLCHDIYSLPCFRL